MSVLGEHIVTAAVYENAHSRSAQYPLLTTQYRKKTVKDHAKSAKSLADVIADINTYISRLKSLYIYNCNHYYEPFQTIDHFYP